MLILLQATDWTMFFLFNQQASVFVHLPLCVCAHTHGRQSMFVYACVFPLSPELSLGSVLPVLLV